MASPTIHPLHSALREATNTAHDALERLPYSEQLAKATLSKEDLARSLHDWRTLYAAVEARSEHPIAEAIVRGARRRRARTAEPTP